MKNTTLVKTEARYRCLPVGDVNGDMVSEVFWVVSLDVLCFVLPNQCKEYVDKCRKDWYGSGG